MTYLLFFGVLNAVYGWGSEDGFWLNNKFGTVDSTSTKIPFPINNGQDTLFLNPLYSEKFEPKTEEIYTVKLISIVEVADVTKQRQIKENDSESYNYSMVCSTPAERIFDSIDFNEDGIKELIILREWNCSVSPPITNEFGVGSEQLRNSRYEIWDINTKQQLAEIHTMNEAIVIVSTNVISTRGYRYQVEFNKNGSFILSGLNGYGNDLAMGIYRYNSKTKLLELK